MHIVSHDYAGRGYQLPHFGYGLTPRRRLLGIAAAAVLLAGITAVLTLVRSHITFATDVSVYLLIVVVTSLVGGFWAAAAAAPSRARSC